MEKKTSNNKARYNNVSYRLSQRDALKRSFTAPAISVDGIAFELNDKTCYETEKVTTAWAKR